MRDGGRIAAALEVLRDFDSRRVPLKVCLADWARGARYAGSKDRAFISGLALDVLRRQRSLHAYGQGDRGAIIRVLSSGWAWPQDRITEAFADEPHGPGALKADEVALLDDPATPEIDDAAAADVPDFLFPEIAAWAEDPIAEARASALRAPFDLRTNTLKADQQKVLKALASYRAEAGEFVADSVRLPLASSEVKSPDLTVTPAYQKGWMEVQDEGSQLAALAAGPIGGAQVLDYCAGGGGKSLALAALMANTGQLFAYDSDAARLAPIFDRLKRAGVRNAQVISPAGDGAALDQLKGRMDVVFVDAPCSGSGTWRRRPDTKWRLTPQQLATRQAEQDAVLREAAPFVAPGGALVYVTCSLFPSENEDRVAAFLSAHPDFRAVDAVAAVKETGAINVEAEGRLPSVNAAGVWRLSPLVTQTDGFSITRIELASA